MVMSDIGILIGSQQQPIQSRSMSSTWGKFCIEERMTDRIHCTDYSGSCLQSVPPFYKKVHNITIQGDIDILLLVENHAGAAPIVDYIKDKEYENFIVMQFSGKPKSNGRFVVSQLHNNVPDAFQMIWADLDNNGVELFTVLAFGSGANTIDNADVALPSANWLGIHYEQSDYAYSIGSELATQSKNYSDVYKKRLINDKHPWAILSLKGLNHF